MKTTILHDGNYDLWWFNLFLIIVYHLKMHIKDCLFMLFIIKNLLYLMERRKIVKEFERFYHSRNKISIWKPDLFQKYLFIISYIFFRCDRWLRNCIVWKIWFYSWLNRCNHHGEYWSYLITYFVSVFMNLLREKPNGILFL